MVIRAVSGPPCHPPPATRGFEHCLDRLGPESSVRPVVDYEHPLVDPQLPHT